MSPHLYNTAFEALGLDSVYLAIEAEDGYIKQDLDGLKLFNFIGGNIRIPHKTKVIEYLDDISPDAKIIASVNTIKIDESEKITGYNTDWRGFVKALEENIVEFEEKNSNSWSWWSSKSRSYQLANDDAKISHYVNQLQS